MHPTKSRIGSGAPSFCWNCGKHLQRAPGKGLGKVYFHLVRDPSGNEHRIHGGYCLEEAKASGSTYIKEPK